MIKGLAHFSYDEMLRNLCLFILLKKRQRGAFPMCMKVLREGASKISCSCLLTRQEAISTN